MSDYLVVINGPCNLTIKTNDEEDKFNVKFGEREKRVLNNAQFIKITGRCGEKPCVICVKRNEEWVYRERWAVGNFIEIFVDDISEKEIHSDRIEKTYQEW